MKKTIICNIPMKRDVEPIVFESDDNSIPVSNQTYRYPVNSFLSQTITEEDEIKVLMLVKNDGNDYRLDNIEFFKKELDTACSNMGAISEYKVIETVFDQQKETHAKLMGRIIDEISDDSHIIADITYGPKDLPIVVFSALFFAENYLRCDVDNIVYGQAEFKDGQVVKSTICDMIPLYYLSSLSNTIQCDDPDKAREMIKILLSM